MSTICYLRPQRGVRGDGNFLCFLYKFTIDMNDILVLFYFYSRRNKSKRHVSGWLRGTVVERRSMTGELSLSCARPSCARPAADG